MGTEEKQRNDSWSFADSDELFEAIYRNELDSFRKNRAQKAEHKKTHQASSVQNHKSPSHFASKRQRKRKPEEEKDGHPALERKGAREEKPAKSWNRPKLGLLFALLVTLGGFFFYYHRGGDVPFLKTIREPTKKETIQRSVLLEPR
jgi:hypothetical protein